ncbi:MAG: hypothetical protein QXF74_05675 [Nitrososphaerota archaeon]
MMMAIPVEVDMIAALEYSIDFSAMFAFFMVIVAIWALVELISSIMTRKYMADMAHTVMTQVATSIAANTQAFYDSMIKTMHLGHVERLEHLRTTQSMINDTLTTARLAIGLDLIRDLYRELEGEK